MLWWWMIKIIYFPFVKYALKDEIYQRTNVDQQQLLLSDAIFRWTIVKWSQMATEMYQM